MAVARLRSTLVGIQQFFEESTAAESSRISEFYQADSTIVSTLVTISSGVSTFGR